MLDLGSLAQGRAKMSGCPLIRKTKPNALWVFERSVFKERVRQREREREKQREREKKREGERERERES